LTPKYDELLSNIAFDFNLRRYSEGVVAWGALSAGEEERRARAVREAGA